MFEATTVFFGSRPAVSEVCSTRAEADLLSTVAEAGLRGPVSLPSAEVECQQVLQKLRNRLMQTSKLIEKIAESRAGSDKLKEQVAEILRQWFIYGKPN